MASRVSVRRIPVRRSEHGKGVSSDGGGDDEEDGEDNKFHSVSYSSSRRIRKKALEPLYAESPFWRYPKALAISGSQGDGFQAGVKEGVKSPRFSSVYIGNIPLRASQKWVFATFARFGIVLYVFIPFSMNRGRVRRFGFVRFCSDFESEGAIKCLIGITIMKWNLIVQRCNLENRRLFNSSLTSRSSEKVRVWKAPSKLSTHGCASSAGTSNGASSIHFSSPKHRKSVVGSMAEENLARQLASATMPIVLSFCDLQH